VLVGRTLQVELDFYSEVLDENGLCLPEAAFGELEDMVRAIFADRLLISQQDPYADHLIKLKRIAVADPALFEFGTSGNALSYHMGKKAEEWLSRAKWNPAPDDVGRVKIALSTVRLGDREFFYDYA